MHVKREVGSVTPSPGLSSRAGRRGEEGSVGWKGGNLLTAEKENSAQRREAHVRPSRGRAEPRFQFWSWLEDPPTGLFPKISSIRPPLLTGQCAGF